MGMFDSHTDDILKKPSHRSWDGNARGSTYLG